MDELKNDDALELYGSVKPHKRPEDFKKVRDKVRKAVARNIVSEDKDFDKLYGIKRQEP